MNCRANTVSSSSLAKLATKRYPPVYSAKNVAVKLSSLRLDSSGRLTSVLSGYTSLKVSLASGSGESVVTVSETVSPICTGAGLKPTVGQKPLPAGNGDHAKAKAKRFLAEQKEDADVEPLAKLALALINLNEFLFVD